MRAFMGAMGLALGAALLFAGERALGPGSAWRGWASGAGAAMVICALLSRLHSAVGATGERRPAMARLLAAHTIGALGLGLYGAGLLVEEGAARTLLRAAWPMVWLAGTLPAVLMEWRLRTMEGARRLEVRRLTSLGTSGLVVALAASWLTLANYVATVNDVDIDTRAVKNLSPSGLTYGLARNIADPVTVTLFFPPSNEVAEVVAPYFAALSKANDRFTVARADQERDPLSAKALGARANGTIVFSRGEQQQRFSIGTEMRAARGALKRMDKEVQTRLSKLTLEGRVVYFVTGHGERSTRPRPGDKPGLRDAKEAFEQLNYKVKTISAGTGLTQRVPEDATLVVVAAPEGPMLSSELEALLAYLDSGGRLLLLLDPQVERPTELEPLTQRLGIKMRSGQVLTHDKEFVQLTKTKADRQFLMAKRFVAHDSTPVLNKISGRAGLLTHTCGGLEKAKAGAGAAAKVVFTVKSMPGTWADLDGDLDFDKDTETRRVQNIVAAVEFPDLDGAPGGRAIVTADADVVSDKVLRFSAVNQQFIVDAIGWLEGSVSLSGEVADLEDVPLMHTRTEDQILFYTTVVAMPSLLLLFGFAARRLGRRPRREGRR